MISKTAELVNNYKKDIYYYNSARDAFLNILNEYNKKMKVTLLLPGYIGVSPNEGSGIFDPVLSSEIKYQFYEMNNDLTINVDEFNKLIASTDNKVIVLFVHYFGYVDKNIELLVGKCREREAIIIEDAAHALYTDYIDHACGQYGDYVLYSLHKMLPFKTGGMLKVNCNQKINITGKEHSLISPFGYDLYQIAQQRKSNARLWNELLLEHDRSIEILRPYSDKETPQTFPIVVKNYDRNQLYFKLNEAGYGAVSLYHTMIDEIKQSKNESAVWLSQHIINMPVHQDVEENEIKKMAKLLISIVESEL